MSRTCSLCPELSQASCPCQTPSLQFCEKHISKHLFMPSSVKHKPIYNTKPNHNNNNNQKIAIASLNSTKQQIRQMQNQIANETSDLMGKLDSQAKFNMKMLQKLTQKINLTIKKILCFSSADLDTIPEKIRNILSIMSEKELRKQTNSWKISKFKIGASGIEETFSNLVTFTIDPKLLELISKDKNKLLDSSDAPQEYDGLNVSAWKSMHEYPNVKNVTENIYEGSPRKGATPLRRSSANPSKEEQSGVNVSFKTAEERLQNQDNYPSVRNLRENVSHKRNSSATSSKDPTINQNTSNSPTKSNPSSESNPNKAFTPSGNNPNKNSANVQNGPNLTCNRNHKLIWNNNTPFQYYALCGSFMINCNLCRNQYSCASWHCKECNYDVCRKCSLNSGISLPLLACNSGHELEWKTDVAMFYRQRNKQPASCSWCQSQTPGPHWHCRSCLFDVCISCAQQRGYISPATSAKCKNKHPLTEKNSDGRILPCLMCKKMFNGKCFLCVDCNYVICDDCQNFLKSPAPGHPIVRCTEKHLLRWHTRGGFNCDACNQNKDEERFKCKECNYDICADCSNSLIASICKTGPKCCPQLHQLLWCFETNEIFLGMPYKCDGCKRINKRIGSYRCAECELDICFTCMAKQSNN